MMVTTICNMCTEDSLVSAAGTTSSAESSAESTTEKSTSEEQGYDLDLTVIASALQHKDYTVCMLS